MVELNDPGRATQLSLGARPVIANHWLRGAKAYGEYGQCIVVQVWWPISDPRPAGSLW